MPIPIPIAWILTRLERWSGALLRRAQRKFLGIAEGVPDWVGRPQSLEKRFVGRDEELKELDRAFKGCRAVVISGGPGSGKSRLAAEYAHRSKALHFWAMRGFWVPWRGTLEQTLSGLAPWLDVDTRGLQESEIADVVRTRLSGLPTKRLLILDNVPSLDQFVALQRAAGPVRLLVTTRDSREHVLPPTASLKMVGVLKPAAAVSLLFSRDCCDRNDPLAAEIAEEVGRLPLALEMLAIRLATAGWTPQSVLEELRRVQNPILIEAFRRAVGTSIERTEGVFATIAAALDSLDGETRGRLAPFGYVADAPIPKLLAMALADVDDGHFPDFLEECASQSLVAAGEGFVEIHGLTVAAIRATNVGDAAPRAALARGHARLAGIYESEPPALRAEMAHYETLLEQARAELPSDGAVLEFANSVAIAYNTLGGFIEAIRLFEQTLADRERILGPEHPDTLTSRNNLANVYRKAGRVAEAIPLHEQTLADRERILGPEHPDTLDSRNNLANAYQEAGRVEEAIPLHEQTLEARERLLGPEHPRTLRSRGNLANAYQGAGRLDDAIPLHEQTLEDQERILGAEHPDTLGNRNNLANAYGDVGRRAEAIALHERTLRDRERLLGPEHPDTLASRNNLAVVYEDTGRVQEAIALHKQTLAVRERILGPEHPDTILSRNNLAVVYRAAGRDEEAERLEGDAGT